MDIVFTILFWLFVLYIFFSSKLDEPDVEETYTPSERHTRRMGKINKPTISTTEPDCITIYPDEIVVRGDQWMSRTDKQAYLHSTKWKTLRQLILHRENHTCVTCGTTSNLQVHHIHYENLGDELETDLTILCGSCHTKLHKKLGFGRDGYYPPD